MKNTTTASRHEINYVRFGTQGQERSECRCGFRSPVQSSHASAVEVSLVHMNPADTCGYCGGGHKTNTLCLVAR